MGGIARAPRTRNRDRTRARLLEAGFEEVYARGFQAASIDPTHPRVMMAVVGPVVGVISGVVLGIFAAIASALLRRRQRVSPQRVN